MNQQQKAAVFKALHLNDGIFLMPNAWNAGSACLLAEGGFSALGTTSAGVAASMGVADYEGNVSRELMLESVRAIVDAVDLPVNADLESGYGESAEQVGETTALAIAAGAVGGNIEDYAGLAAGQSPLFARAISVERIRAARKAADACGIPFTLTARTDCFMVPMADPFAEAVERANLFVEAGADCLFIPGAKDIGTIERLVRELNGPLTVVMGFSGPTMTVADLQSVGVRRISIGGSLARATFGLIRRAAAEMAQHGTFTFANDAIPDPELRKFFTAVRAR
jgi:2-methylisocitrate lyase-like PEP mutase family enzyme